VPGRPLVLAHRGASARCPENTLEAFATARDLGADGVELDVRRTADGVLVVHHDPEIPGLGLVAAQPFGRLRDARPDVPTLREALAACAGMLVNVEVKCLPWEPDADPAHVVVAGALDCVREAAAHAVVSSFSLDAADAARAHAPEVPTALLVHGQDPARVAALAAARGHGWLHPDVASTRADPTTAVAACHDAGLRVDVWTVDDPGDARALAAAGVDALITNVPDVVLAALA
jgi:glycerophosphoryl diester phosphodiesterase